MLPEWATRWTDRSGGRLTDEQIGFLEEIEEYVTPDSAWWHRDSQLDHVALKGPADDPQLVTYFRATQRRPGLLLAFEWSLRHDDPDYAVWTGNFLEVLAEAGCRLPTIVGPDGVARR